MTFLEWSPPTDITSDAYSDITSGILFDICVYFICIYILTLHVSFYLAFCLAFYLIYYTPLHWDGRGGQKNPSVHFLNFQRPCQRTGEHILSGIQSDMMYILTFYLEFFVAFYLTSGAHRWGPAALTSGTRGWCPHRSFYSHKVFFTDASTQKLLHTDAFSTQQQKASETNTAIFNITKQTLLHAEIAHTHTRTRQNRIF